VQCGGEVVVGVCSPKNALGSECLNHPNQAPGLKVERKGMRFLARFVYNCPRISKSWLRIFAWEMMESVQIFYSSMLHALTTTNCTAVHLCAHGPLCGCGFPASGSPLCGVYWAILLPPKLVLSKSNGCN
jgi:hypothetical protein